MWGTMRAVTQRPDSLTTALHQHIAQAIAAEGGWLGFDRFMALALYTPGLGYYANDSTKFGAMPESGSDFVTAPELTPLFGQTLAVQVGEALERTGTDEVWEFGAGSGALALQLLDALGDQVQRYTIVDLSGSLRARQQAKLLAHAHKLRWVDALPEKFSGVVVGNEVLDAMPVQAAGAPRRPAGRCVARARRGGGRRRQLCLGRPPHRPAPAHRHRRPARLPDRNPRPGRRLHPHAGRPAQRGAAFLLDYGFGEDEYYHPQRHMGTVMCHQGHLADGDPLVDVGRKDITAHVNFTAMALAAQEAGMQVLGYTTQAHFLINCGLLSKMELLAQVERATAAKLIMEHEMGELFKVLALGAGDAWEPVGFARGDRSHRL
jgi:SAM-dependent MidA family methyltransferase